MKYLLLGAIASAVILYGMALLFGLTGTTRLVAPDGELSIATAIARTRRGHAAGLLLASVLLIAGLGFKMAVVPFQMWVPDVYEGAPTPVAAFLSVASKAAAFAVVLRIFFEGLPDDVDQRRLVDDLRHHRRRLDDGRQRAWPSCRPNIKRLLGYSSIAQAGNFMVGLAAVAARTAGSTSAPAACCSSSAAYAFTNLGAFIVDHRDLRPHRQRRDQRLRRPVRSARRCWPSALGLRADLADGHPADGRLHRQAVHLQRRRRRAT